VHVASAALDDRRASRGDLQEQRLDEHRQPADQALPVDQTYREV
jgi:hypothetical protein